MYSPSLPSSTLTGAAFFHLLKTPSSFSLWTSSIACSFFISKNRTVKIKKEQVSNNEPLLIKKVHFFVIFFDILTSFSSRSAIEAHGLMLGIIKALNASALPTHSRRRALKKSNIKLFNICVCHIFLVSL